MTHTLRPASPEDERFAVEVFDISLSFEEWAAHNAHEFAMFSFDEIQYESPALRDWVQGLAEWLFAPNLGERLSAARKRFLSAELIAKRERSILVRATSSSSVAS